MIINESSPTLRLRQCVHETKEGEEKITAGQPHRQLRSTAWELNWENQEKLCQRKKKIAAVVGRPRWIRPEKTSGWEIPAKQGVIKSSQQEAQGAKAATKGRTQLG